MDLYCLFCVRLRDVKMMESNKYTKKNLEEIEKMAEEILVENDMMKVPVDTVKLAKKYNAEIQTMEMESKATGVLIVNKKEKVLDTNSNILILLKKDMGLQKSRFVLLHELAHYLFHKDNGSLFAKRDYDNMHSDDPEEHDADVLAKCLLMPKTIIMSFLTEYLINNNHDDPAELISVVASKFCVTENKAKSRLIDLKILVTESNS